MLCVLVGLLIQVPPTLAETVISQIRVGPRDGQTEIEVSASEPLNYVILEHADPAGVTLFFLNATFAFPPREQAAVGGGIQRMATRVIERDGSRLARLEITFTARAPYKVTQERKRVLVRVEIPLRGGGMIWDGDRLAQPPAPTQVTPPQPELPQPQTAQPPTSQPKVTRPQVMQPPGSQPQVIQPRPQPEPPLRPATSVLKLSTNGTDEDTKIRIDANGPLRFKAFTLQDPPRVVLDLQGVTSKILQAPAVPSNSVILRIRISEFQPGVLRIAIDLRRASPYWIEPKPESLVVHFGIMAPKRE